MNWLDFSIIFVFVLAVLIEAKRGFGRALFDFAALLITVWGISRIELLWKAASFSSDVHAALYGGSFLIIGGLLMIIGRLAHQSTLISAPPFDVMLGSILGIGTALVLCYGIVHMVALTGGPKGLPPVLSCSALGKEFVTFDTYHRVLYVLQHFDNARPNPG
jgi:hypothetical protein